MAAVAQALPGGQPPALVRLDNRPVTGSMTFEQAADDYQAALAAKTELLTAALRRLLVQRPFVPDLGATLDMIDALHFEYDWPSSNPSPFR
jgi:hypothetical protein